MKLTRSLLVVAVFAVSWSVARADGTDPKVFTSGCGGIGQPACDAEFLTQSSPSELDNVIFTFLSATDPTNPDPGNVAAFVDVINWTGSTVGDFTLNLSPTDSNGDALTYQCGTAPEGSTGSFSCAQNGDNPDSFVFTALPGGGLCSVPLPPDYSGIYSYLNLHQNTCQYGERFFLEASLPGDPTNLVGQTVTATIFAPEPPSGLLLLIGLAAGAFLLRKRSLSLA